MEKEKFGARVNKNGGVTVPKEVREELDINHTDHLILEIKTII